MVEPGEVSIVLNRGDGTFEDPRITPGGRENAAVPFRVNGDDLPDLLLYRKIAYNGGPMQRSFSVLLNLGGGGFADPEIHSLHPKLVLLALAAADLDRNGRQELAVLAGEGETTEIMTRRPRLILFGAPGDGRLVEGASVFLKEQRGITVAAADLDGDGDPDYIVGASGRVSFLIREGNDRFREAVVEPFPWGREFGRITAIDFDGDEDPDVLATGEWWYHFNHATVLLNRGRGDFSRQPRFMAFDFPVNVFGLTAADFDGDGLSDLAGGVCLRPIGAGGEDFVQAVAVFLNRTAPAASRDLDLDGFPDECAGLPFHRGDPDGDGETILADALFLLDHLFLGGREPACLESGDADNDGELTVADPIYLIQHLFLGGPPPAAPGQAPGACGRDPDPPTSPGDLGCGAYANC